jgi:hypothetical protein
VISTICEVFGCTPTEAEAQDLNLVRAILEMRDAKEVLRIEEEGSEFEQQWLAKHPGMAVSKLALLQAQDTMYENAAMAGAVAALRDAEKERSIQGE